jgi:hypothetical protein
LKLAHALIALATALALSTPARAQQTTTLLPDSVNLTLIDGSTIPSDCMFPTSIADMARFETACVTMPRFVSNEIASQYIAQLGEQGWHQGSFISGGMTAERTDEDNCRHVLNIFPSDCPAGTANSATVVIWFAMDRTPRCNQAQPG